MCFADVPEGCQAGWSTTESTRNLPV
jgi:hypothetical protein